MKNILPILVMVMLTMSSCGLMVGGLIAVSVTGMNPNNLRPGPKPPIDFSDSTAADYDEEIEEVAVDTTAIEVEEAPVEADTTKPDRTLPPDLLGEEEPTDGSTTTLKLFNPEVDLGTIEYGDSIRHTFKYKNTGKVDFIIEQYTVGCGCTEISSPKKRLVPGETGEITLQFNSKEKDGPGDYTSDAMLIGNTGMGFVEFMMKIKVVEKKE